MLQDPVLLTVIGTASIALVFLGEGRYGAMDVIR